MIGNHLRLRAGYAKPKKGIIRGEIFGSKIKMPATVQGIKFRIRVGGILGRIACLIETCQAPAFEALSHFCWKSRGGAPGHPALGGLGG